MSVENWQRNRLRIVFICLLLAFGALLVRLVQLQWHDYGFYARQAEKQHRTRVPLYAHRGMILDREGRTLAMSTEVDSVCADPLLIQDKGAVAKTLSEILQVDYVEIVTKLEKEKCRFAWIKRKVTREEAERVTAMKSPGVFLWPEEKRTYPLGHLAGHVIGFVGYVNDEKNKGVREEETQGCAGIELLFNPCLAGSAGYQYITRDGRKRCIASAGLDYKPPQHGYTVVLTIDQIVQQIVEEALDDAVRLHNPKGAVAIAMSPQTGEIVGMASRPSFDPNDYANYAADAQRDRAITDYYEPGSTFKTFVFLAALDQNVIDLNESFDCHMGAFKVGRRTIHDVHKYGVLPAPMVLVHSSNIGMAQIGLKLGRRGLMNCVETYDFGRATGIELPAEDPGKVQKRWTDYSLTSIPMGQEIGLTPLQLVTAYAAVANGGVLVKPRIVRGVADSSGTKMLRLFPTPCKVRRVASEDVVRKKLIPILCNVVDEGTGTLAKLQDYVVAGKTGTAQKLTREGPTAKYVSSFVGFAPASDPKIVVLVLMDECSNGAYYGGTVSAPAAARIIDRTLKYWHVPPDTAEQRAVVGKGM